MSKSPVTSYRPAPDTIKRIEALKHKLGVKANSTVIEMAIKRMAEQELGTSENLIYKNNIIKTS